MTVAAIRHSAGSLPARAGRPVGWLVRESSWPDFTERRAELRLTRGAVARALTAEGKPTSVSLVKRWEREGWQPSESRIEPLARVLRVRRQAVLAMFSLDFGPEDRAGDDETDRLPVADRGGR